MNLIVSETFDRLDEALVAVEVSEAPQCTGYSYHELAGDRRDATDGFAINACARRLREVDADVVSFNCRQEPERALAILRKIRELDDGPLAIQLWSLQALGHAGVEPRPGLLAGNEVNPDASEGLQIDRQTWRKFALQTGELGVSYLGGCSGAGPSATFGMAKVIGKLDRLV